jgi:hypothetical protein
MTSTIFLVTLSGEVRTSTALREHYARRPRRRLRIWPGTQVSASLIKDSLTQTHYRETGSQKAGRRQPSMSTYLKVWSWCKCAGMCERSPACRCNDNRHTLTVAGRQRSMPLSVCRVEGERRRYLNIGLPNQSSHPRKQFQRRMPAEVRCSRSSQRKPFWSEGEYSLPRRRREPDRATPLQ